MLLYLGLLALFFRCVLFTVVNLSVVNVSLIALAFDHILAESGHKFWFYHVM